MCGRRLAPVVHLVLALVLALVCSWVWLERALLVGTQRERDRPGRLQEEWPLWHQQAEQVGLLQVDLLRPLQVGRLMALQAFV